MFSNNNCILFLKEKFTVPVSILPDVISSIMLKFWNTAGEPVIFFFMSEYEYT